MLQVLAQTGAPTAGSLDAEREPIRAIVALGPLLQLGVTGGSRRERELAQQLAERVDRHRAMALLVGVDPDCDHRYLLIVWKPVRVMWRPPDRAVSSDVQASMKSRRHPWTTAGDRSLRGH
jgi:hypothetical protein